MICASEGPRPVPQHDIIPASPLSARFRRSVAPRMIKNRIATQVAIKRSIKTGPKNIQGIGQYSSDHE
jgi:hypothetical protein